MDSSLLKCILIIINSFKSNEIGACYCTSLCKKEVRYLTVIVIFLHDYTKKTDICDHGYLMFRLAWTYCDLTEVRHKILFNTGSVEAVILITLSL